VGGGEKKEVRKIGREEERKKAGKPEGKRD
jgi:hypothetical protein